MDHVAFSHTAAEQAFSRMLPSSVSVENTKTASAGLTLEQCREIALANNLAIKLAKLEQINRSYVNVGDWAKMLPHAILSAKFDQGDNILYSDLPGDSYWAEFYARSSWHLFLETRWSPTEVAVAYYTARNSKNRLLQTFYEKVRLCQKIIETVDVCFFRLLSIQDCLPLAKDLVSLRTDIAGRMERLHKERLVSMDDYQKALSDEMKAHYLLAELNVESERQTGAIATQLGRAIRVKRAPQEFAITGSLSCPGITEVPPDPEIVALRNRPEIVALGLKHYESSNDFRKSIIKNFPRMTLFWRYLKDPYHDRRHRDGQQAGLLLYMDLVESLSQFKETQAASNSSIRTGLELNAITLAVTSQAVIAAKKYRLAAEKAALRTRAVAGAERVLRAAQQRVQSSNLSEISEKKARAELTGEKIELLRALGDANVSLAELRSALGTNYSAPLP